MDGYTKEAHTISSSEGHKPEVKKCDLLLLLLL
jgi:hypothetical protein